MQITGATHRLPANYMEGLPADADGTLHVEERNVPVHPLSVARMGKFIQSDGIGQRGYFVPEIPISSDLGMPRYEPLLYWTPANAPVYREPVMRVLRRWASNAKSTLLRRPLRHSAARSSLPFLEGARKISESTKEEQVHYFSDHFGAISPKPIQVSVVLSNTCNLKCIMCPYHSPDIRPTHTTDFFDEKRFMSWENMQRIAQECGELKVGVKVGNIEEPLLHPKILDFIRLARKLGSPTFHITTNGLPLTDKKIRELFDAGLTSVYVSIDAARPDTYARVRGADLAKVEANVRKLLNIRKEMGVSCSIRTSFVKNKGVSAEEIVEFRERWVEEADGVIFYNLAEMEAGNSHFEEIHRFVDEKMRNAKERWACLSPFQEIYLLPDGRVYYCCETVSKLAFENLTTMGKYPDESITQLWHGDLFRALRRDLILNKLGDWPACEGCGIWMAHVGQSRREGKRVIHLNMITEIVDKAA